MGIFKDDEWIVGKVDAEGYPLIVRARKSFPSLADREIFRHLIVITWEYQSNDSGLPVAESRKRIYEFEDVVDNHFADGRIGELAASITGHGEKEWRYYTHSPSEFMAELNSILQGLMKCPIELNALEDPEWRSLHELQASGA